MGRRCRSVAPSPEYTVSGDYRSRAPDGSAQGPSSHLTVADHRRPDAVLPQKCTRSPSETGDLEQFHGKSARGPLKILRCAQDDSVGAWIGVILKGAAVRLHARSARRWGSLGSCPKRVVFRHGTDSILHCRPQVSSQKKDTCRGVERSVLFFPHL